MNNTLAAASAAKHAITAISLTVPVRDRTLVTNVAAAWPPDQVLYGNGGLGQEYRFFTIVPNAG